MTKSQVLLIESESVGEEEKKEVRERWGMCFIREEQENWLARTTGGALLRVWERLGDWAALHEPLRTCKDMQKHAKTGRNMPEASKWLRAAAPAPASNN